MLWIFNVAGWIFYKFLKILIFWKKVAGGFFYTRMRLSFTLSHKNTLWAHTKERSPKRDFERKVIRGHVIFETSEKKWSQRFEKNQKEKMFDMSRSDRKRFDCHLISERFCCLPVIEIGLAHQKTLIIFEVLRFKVRSKKIRACQIFIFKAKVSERQSVFTEPLSKRECLIQIQKKKTCLGHVTFF